MNRIKFSFAVICAAFVGACMGPTDDASKADASKAKASLTRQTPVQRYVAALHSLNTVLGSNQRSTERVQASMSEATAAHDAYLKHPVAAGSRADKKIENELRQLSKEMRQFSGSPRQSLPTGDQLGIEDYDYYSLDYSDYYPPPDDSQPCWLRRAACAIGQTTCNVVGSKQCGDECTKLFGATGGSHDACVQECTQGANTVCQKLWDICVGDCKDCTKKTCTDYPGQCGTLDDGCKGTITCTDPSCACVKRTCADYPGQCGDLDDGCNGTIHCGQVDECGVCNGDGTSCCQKDACGVCNGDGSSCCQTDVCGVCGGDGSSCSCWDCGGGGCDGYGGSVDECGVCDGYGATFACGDGGIDDPYNCCEGIYAQ
jgi:hypothetical protein